jgi:hypothetical protein
MRGIAVTYQLEEGEILGEPLPARDNRRSILAYEATEGGAGVLNRLVEDAHALGKVAREALSLMHFDKVDEAIAAGDAKLLVDRDSDACVRGCYRCLLSYFNQPDHELIDRASDEAKQMLIDLARGEIVLAKGSPRCGGADGWDASLQGCGHPGPGWRFRQLCGPGDEFCLAHPFCCRLHQQPCPKLRERSLTPRAGRFSNCPRLARTACPTR